VKRKKAPGQTAGKENNAEIASAKTEKRWRAQKNVQ